MIWKKYRGRNVSSKVLQFFIAEISQFIFLTGFVAGGIFVNLAAKKFMQSIIDFKYNCRKLNSSCAGRLRGTEWDSPQSIELAVSNFERNAKRKVISIYLFIVVPN